MKRNLFAPGSVRLSGGQVTFSNPLIHGQGLLDRPGFFGQVSFLGGPGTKPPPSETSPELAKKPHASTVDELCQLGRKMYKDPLGSNLSERAIDVLRKTGANEDVVLEDLKKYCPDGLRGLFGVIHELRERRRIGIYSRKPVQNPVPSTTTRGTVPATPTPRANQPTGQLRPLQPQGWQDVATQSATRPATMQPSSFEPVAAQQPIPVRQNVPTPSAAIPSTPTPATLQPSTPTAQASQYQWQETPQYQGTPWPGTPTASQAASQGAGGCPPGQIPDGYGGCLSVGQMPSIPGGLLTPTTAATATLAPTAMPATSFVGSRVALRGRHSNGNLEWWGYQQSFIPPLYFSRPRVARATLGAGKPVPPGICCQATKDGGAICSTGQGFPPTCPNKPEPNVPGVAEYIQQGAYLVPKPPPAPVNGVCGGAPAPAPEEPAKDEGSAIPPLVGIAAVGALVYAVVEGLL